MRFKRVARRVGRKVVKAAKKRYMKRGSLNVSRIAKDVKMLKHLVNVEKKRFDITLTTPAPVSLSFNAAQGAYAAIISPAPIEGTGNGERVGNSIKLVSAMINLRFSQQGSAVNPIHIKYWIVCRPDNATSYTANSTFSHFLEPNPFSTQRDYHSNRDPEYFTSMKVITSGTVHLKQDSITGGQSIVQRKVPLKLNHHLKYNTDSSTITTKNQFYLFAVASEGDQALSTGGLIQYNIRWYYTDN